LAIEKITMPQLGESVTEGTITSWLVSVGDKVNKYDPLAEVQTDKVNAEVPSSYSGTVKELVVNEGETVAVGELICYIETEAVEETEIREKKSDVAIESIDAPNDDQSMKKRYSPAVLRLAQEHNIDLEQVSGSGKGGRITRKDIHQLIESGELPKTGTKQEATAEAANNEQPVSLEKQRPAAVQTSTGDIEIPVTGVRKAIASNMVRSKSEVPHAWMMIEADVTNLVQYRDTIKTDFKAREGFNLTYFAFFVKAVAEALKEFPMMNAMWAGDKIIQKKAINLSIAVGTDDELYVPVIKYADEKSIKGIARDISELAAKVRNGKLTADDMQGGTFTVNSTGAFGSVQSMGIINYPQAAILQVESIVKRPVVVNNNMIAIRDMVNLCLSLDHRVLDGVVCGRFLNRVKEILENMSEENTSVY
jgi:2-oxoisovalerate dehydrogenase E2 component (dihydrolipoyl transacylase)